MPNFLSDLRRRRMAEMRQLETVAVGSRGRTLSGMTPPINPDEGSPMSSALPEPAPSPSGTYAPAGIPGGAPSGGMPGPVPPELRGAATLPGQGRAVQMREARDVYLKNTPSRKRGLLLGLARGALGGLASGQGLGGLIGGAATGAALGGITPRTMRELEFEERVKPKILEGYRYEDADRARQMAEAKAQQESAFNQARMGRINTQNQADLAGIDINRQNAQRQQAVAESTIKLNEARAEAARTGRSVVRDVVDEDGQVRTYQIGADGSMTELGGSARAAINRTNVQSRERMAARREAGANARAAARQTTKKPFKGYVGMDRIRKYMADTGKSENEAIVDALNDGYRVRTRR